MINTINGILEAAKGGKTGVIAVAAAHDQPVIEAVVEARKEGIATPILVGHVDEIRTMLSGLGENPDEYQIIAGDSDTDCAAKAVALCADGKANFLMKGILGTADLMRAVFNKEHGLRTSHLTTHCMFYEIPAYGKMVILTDGGVNTFPDLDKKAEILENAAMVLQALGYETINAACICGAEVVNPKIQSTVDRREYYLRPTQKYIEYYSISYAYLHKVIERARQRFSPEDLAKLEEMLTIVSDELMPELDMLRRREPSAAGHPAPEAAAADGEAPEAAEAADTPRT